MKTLHTIEDLESSCFQCKKDLVLSGEYGLFEGWCEICFLSLEDEVNDDYN